ncbi:Pentatricopeptide repeat domain-containing protein 3, mitochondrial [Liparis tanakae]|uniref:Small ribosomal subunit protein mS39 n=1 Tax=Liparis tanakae TaxID=230148 RepID=A0A4Z2HM43_9TELE|nr:Pentatricopeptide repeat domain-containing protein 3, mitochondrial [Liparis tanakae]
MAAPGRHVGHYIQRNSRFLRNNIEQLWSHRSFGWTPALQQQAAEANKDSTDTFLIPRKKTWSKEAVLEALASTVGRDPTAHPYHFQDDPYLSPRTSSEFRLYSLSLESGKSAAKYFVNSNPKFFTTDFAEPHIPCLMPESVTPLLEEMSEEALKERISLRKVTAAVDMYDQLLQTGTAVSMETTHELLDLICLYCDRDPVQEGGQPAEEAENSNAERIFNLLPERDTRCYSALIRGMVKHGAYAKAYSMYTDMLNNRVTAPSLASFDHILAVFSKAASPGQGNTDILQEVMSVLGKNSFICQDPNDVLFFTSAMRICLDNKDLELGYKIQTLVEHGENWRLLGDSYQQSTYYGRFFNLLCMMEHIDVVLKWYRRLIPSLYYPNPQGLKDLLQALDTDSRLDMLPTIWKDIRSLGHDNKTDLVEELLALMARDRHSPEVQEAFAACALDVKSAFGGDRGKASLEWSSASLSHITSLLLRANKTPQAWEMLQLFKSKNRVPDDALMDDFLSACCGDSSPKKAVELVQLSAAFGLAATPRLAKRTLAEFQVTEEQRAVLSELETTGETSD